MERIKHHLTVLSKNKKYRGKQDKIYEYLSQCLDIDDDMKNLIFWALRPRPLLDMELPSRILSYRGEAHKNGYLEPNVTEVGLLLEAMMTRQYRSFILHTLHAFHNPEMIYPLGEGGCTECCICKKKIWSYDEWEELCKQYPSSGEAEKKEFLAFASDHTGLSICMPCLIQLNELHHLLEVVEGDNYLDWRVNQWDRILTPRNMWNPAGEDSEDKI